MAWIAEIGEEQARGRLRELYEEIGRARGKVANIMRVHSLLPRTMEAHLRLYLAMMFAPGGLSREERELVATVISARNGCGYCVRHHGEALHHYWKDRGKVGAASADYTRLPLPARQRAMLDYAVKLTSTPADMAQADVQLLREAGLSDQEILSLNLIVSYFNFVNRVAQGLGVEFDEAEATGYEY
ncbi:MAG: peroxidase-related enzyme [Candidatus Bipolaricaulaceae bacterium]